MRYVFILLAFALMSSLLAQVPEYVPADALVAWYPLDGGGTDISGNDVHLSENEVTSAANRLNEPGKALQFNGESSYLMRSSALDLLENSDSFSVQFWAKAGPTSTVEPQCIFYEGFPGEFHFANADPGIDFTSYHWAAKAGGNNWFGPGDVIGADWFHVVGVQNAGLLNLYIDGEFIGSDFSGACCVNAPNDQMVVGARRVTSYIEHPFDGTIDDLGLWNRALTEEEILALYLSEQSIPGCLDTEACNFMSAATQDDDSCTYPADGQTCDDLCVLALPDTIVQCFNSSTLIEAGVQRGTFFDGVDDWVLTSESGVTGMNPMSVSFWALTDHNGAMDIFTQATDDDSWADIRFGMNTPQCGLVGPSFKSPAHFATFPYPVDNRNWHHYAYVLGDGSMSFSNLKIYVDGELHSASTGEEFCGHNWGGWTYDAADVPIRFGVGLPLGGFYSGYLDDMALWSKALSQDEVFEIMANDAMAVSEDLVSFWPLDQLEDGFFLDVVGNNHGAPVGGVGTETPLPQGVVTWFSGSQMPNLVVTPNQTTAYSIQSVLESGQVCADTTVVEVIDFEYADLNGNGICDQLEGEGCMDPVACNYSEFALVDDGSCDFSCCPGPGCCSAPNVWDPATQMCVITAASCGDGTVWDESLQQCLPEDMCFADLDNDGVVGMADLLDLLTQFGSECAE